MQKAVGDFQGGVSTFQSLLDKLVSEVQKEREKLEQEKAQLLQDRQDFEDESKRVAQVTKSVRPALQPCAIPSGRGLTSSCTGCSQ